MTLMNFHIGHNPRIALFKGKFRFFFHCPDICSVLDISYQSIPYALLQEYLGGLEEEPLAALIKECGWSLQGEGGVVSIRNQETTIRPKKILAKIEFDSEWVWLDTLWVWSANGVQQGGNNRGFAIARGSE